MIRKVALGAISVFIPEQHVYSQAMLGIFVLVAATILHTSCKPYQDRELYNIELYALLVSDITMVCSCNFGRFVVVLFGEEMLVISCTFL